MNGWTVKAHPLAEVELKALPADLRARFLHIAELLETFGPQNVGLPHIRPLEGKLWEMRMQGKDGIARAVYAAVHGRTLLVLHAFVKKTQTTRALPSQPHANDWSQRHEDLENPQARNAGRCRHPRRIRRHGR